jgi:ATP-binding cassette subfamily B protein
MNPHTAVREKGTGFRGILSFCWPALREQRLWAGGGVAALLIEVVFRCLEPWPLKFIFDRVFHGPRRGKWSDFAFLEGYDSSVLIVNAGMALLVIAAVRALASYFSTMAFVRLGNRVLTEVRGEVYRHLQGLSLSFHRRARNGELVLRIMGDVNLLKDVVITAVLPLLANFLVLICMFGVMFWINAKLALLALAVLPLVGLWTARLGRQVRETARKQRKRDAGLAAAAAETFAAIPVVQALCLEGVFADIFLRRNQESNRSDFQGARLSAALERSTAFFVAAGTALVVWYGASLVLRGRLTPGELLVFMAYLKTALRPVQDLSKFTGRMAKAAAASERVFNLLQTTAEVCELPNARSAPPFQGAIRFEDVSFAYESGRPILEHLDFEVQPGQQVALIGPSGIGKSTIVNLLLRFYDPHQGRVTIDGIDVRDYTLASLRSQIGVVLQDTVLFAASVRENIAYGAANASPEAVETAARLANAHEFIQSLPQGYDTVLGERGLTLSGGQRQRLAIARAAIRRTPILLLDEPVTGLDRANERMVLDALGRLSEGRTTIIITHDPLLAARADLILLLEEGRVRERGSHDALIRADGRYAALYRRQHGSFPSLPVGHFACNGKG